MSEKLGTFAQHILSRKGHDTEFLKTMGYYVSVQIKPDFCWLKCKKCGRTFEVNREEAWVIKQMINGYAYEDAYSEDSKSCADMIIQDIIK